MNHPSQDRPQDACAGPSAGPWDELQSLLDRQIEEAQRGNFSAVDALAGQSGMLVEQLTRNGGAETTESTAAKAAIRDSYHRLLLMLTAANRDLAHRLSLVRQGKRLLRVYRRSTA